MKSTIEIKAVLKTAGTIALAAIIALSFTACGGNRNGGSIPG